MNAAQVNKNNQPQGNKGLVPLQFLFTEDGFCPDGRPEQLSPADQKLLGQFEQDRYGALYHMGLAEKSPYLSPSAAFLYQVSDAFFKTLTSLPELEISRGETRAEPSEEAADRLIRAVPFVIGAEYITEKWIRGIFRKLNEIFSREIGDYDGTVEMYLTEKNQHLHVPERIFFHLVENKDDDFPFAFLATYATRGEDGKVRHVPLKYALTEYKNEREKLLALLACLNRAAEVSNLISGFVENGEMFHPLRLTSEEAYIFLKQIEDIESTGILCRIPNWWKRKAAQVSMSVSMGEEKPSMLGFDTLVSMRPELTVDGVPLSREDIELLLAQTDGLAFLKGKWIEVDHERLKKLLEDLLEASKATTGNLEVSLEPCEVGVLLSQAVGEYQQRMEEKQLDLIIRQPDEIGRIMADGRHLWRVFDNLLNNICKYAQERSRVYLSVEERDGYVRIIFRNMSKYPLDISAEELEERFVRGDKSRHMEGNGLGLSIAKSLVELQDGEMEITIDGDLFKVTLRFAVT